MAMPGHGHKWSGPTAYLPRQQLMAVDLLTDWTQELRSVVYLEHDGNKNTVKPHVRLQYLPTTQCPHYPANQVGDPF